MGSWTSWVGSGAGLVAIGVAMLIRKYAPHLPPKMQAAVGPWIIRGVIVLMFMGGAFLAVVGTGHWVTHTVLHWAVTSAGGWGKAGAIILTLSLVLAVIVGLINAWPKAATAALLLPFLFGLFGHGFYHDVDKQVSPKARHGSSQLTNWLGTIGKK